MTPAEIAGTVVSVLTALGGGAIVDVLDIRTSPAGAPL